ncbi:neoverrucotoxin subunit beta-like [Chiloscyllium plagiosum]|uniref:neoverrucotoxin subunit beta-like n=1 Tax=Chiloscyllium plagiosum TaxID=36176 RepID=UPI001CB7E866|nr:neoverrucotoxin subunit beta-like [Chiloscyllium plagiosum]XP_043539017.1 neoverrucotoxin subunit beta-like [Chiloscyllium plagiosum]XP_043539018.1 neoverrucotoxin subunit beta-like [Chiloscyllium plagiosum]XP_043539019.1 neoverrucotoxin subunit beta-like [Chiloscyllium plagiosum]
MAEGGNSIFQMAALGRPFRIGMLYDLRSDTIIPGVTLWDLVELQKNIDVQVKPSTDFTIISSDAIEDKTSSLDVEASLKASFLGGLVKVSGSAKYLNNKKTSRQQSRVSLQYRATTRFEELTMSQLGPQHITYPSVFKQGSATHVVTGLLYGAQAFFVFDQDHSSTDNVQDIQENLEVMIRKIPTFKIKGQGSVDMSEEDKKRVKKFCCTFQGDFFLDKNPVNYEDAIEVYSKLPKLLGDHRENAMPLRVWLHPLKMLDSKAAQLAHEVSIGLVNQCQWIMDQFCDIEMRYNDLIKSPAARAFSEIKDKLQTFKRMVLEFQTLFQKRLAQVLPSIRAGRKGESSLEEMLEQRERSPFKYSLLDAWLKKREKEVNTVGVNLSRLEGVEVVTQSQLDTILVDPMIKFVICFNFNSLGETDVYLQELSKYLKAPRNETEPNGAMRKDTSQASEDWFDVASVLKRLREAVHFYLVLLRSKGSQDPKFVISSLVEKSIPGASIFEYEYGIVKTRDSSQPQPQSSEGTRVASTSVILSNKVSGEDTEPVLISRMENIIIEDSSLPWENYDNVE